MSFPPGLSMSPTFAGPARGDLLAGRYRIERKIGTGGMGVVVAALDEATGKRVAVKLLLPQGPLPTASFLNANDSGIVARTNRHEELATRLLREASAASRLASEHITRVLDIGRLESGDPFVVMELLDGADLGRYAKERGALPIVEVVSLVLQACEAIAEAHALGIVHRDLKPANLFLTRKPDGTPFLKVLDFGISKVLGADDNQLTGTSDMLGSPLYMAPEQIRNARDVDGRADVWSLGTILYRLLAGRAAFESDGAAATLAAIIGDAPEPLRNLRPDVPPELDAVVRQCLEKDRTRRIQSVRELMIALTRFSVMQTGAFALAPAAAAMAAPAPDAGAFAASVAPNAVTGHGTSVASSAVTGNGTSVAPNAVTVSGPRARPLALVAVALLFAAFLGGGLVAWRIAAGGASASGHPALAPSALATPTTGPVVAPPSTAGTPLPATAATTAAPAPTAVPSALPSATAAASALPSVTAATKPSTPPTARPGHGKPSEDPLGDRL